MRTELIWSGLITTSLAMTGCASQNYDFTSTSSERSRITQMVDELEQFVQCPTTDEKELYEIRIVPLMHSQLHVFAKSGEGDGPAEYLEAEIESYLPLFGFFNGKFTQYDERQQLIVRHEIESNLWGAFRDETEIVVTPSGNRERTRHTFLWLFSWWGDERWLTTENMAHKQGPETEEAGIPSRVQHSSK